MQNPETKPHAKSNFKNLTTTPTLTLSTNPLLSQVTFFKKEGVSVNSANYSILSSDSNVDKRKKQVVEGQDLSALIGKNSK